MAVHPLKNQLAFATQEGNKIYNFMENEYFLVYENFNKQTQKVEYSQRGDLVLFSSLNCLFIHGTITFEQIYQFPITQMKLDFLFFTNNDSYIIMGYSTG